MNTESTLYDGAPRDPFDRSVWERYAEEMRKEVMQNPESEDAKDEFDYALRTIEFIISRDLKKAA
jgi:hypothetical protein